MEPFPNAHVSIPSSSELVWTAEHSPSTAPGPDGIPYAGWRTKSGGRTLHRVQLRLERRLSLPMRFNECLQYYPPKGSAEGDKKRIKRRAGQTRPLGCKNSDNKDICKAYANSSRKSLVGISSVQRGFVPGRQLVSNVLDLDTHARIIGKQLHSDSLPVLALFDIMAAFPSVAHRWIRVVLNRACLHLGLRNLIFCLYSLASAVGPQKGEDGESIFLYWIWRGVLQGCPLSGFIWAIVFDPFLRILMASFQDPGYGVLRACADDVGAALKHIKFLRIFERVFFRARMAAGLSLGLPKCKLIPVAVPFTSAVRDQVRSWLEAYLPEWSTFEVVPSGVYLGFALGPGVTLESWEGPLSKLEVRARAIGGAKAPPTVSTLLYNSRAVPVVGYVPQLVSPPPSLYKSESLLASHVFHVPPNSFTISNLVRVSEFGGVPFRSAVALSLATAVRAAYATFSDIWGDLWDLLARAGMIGTTQAERDRGIYWGPHWKTCAMIARIHHLRTMDCTARSADTRWEQALKIGVSCARAFLAARRARSPFATRWWIARGLQKAVTKAIADGLFRDGPTVMVQRRLRAHFPHEESSVLNAQWEEIFRLLRGAPTFLATDVVKTWANAWTTSHRMGETEKLACLFCARPSGDDWKHYAGCAKMWQFIYEGWGRSDPGFFQDRLGLAPRDKRDFLPVASAFQLFHKLKLSSQVPVGTFLGWRESAREARIRSLMDSIVRALRDM